MTATNAQELHALTDTLVDVGSAATFTTIGTAVDVLSATDQRDCLPCGPVAVVASHGDCRPDAIADADDHFARLIHSHYLARSREPSGPHKAGTSET